jgi:hypothetical protein
MPNPGRFSSSLFHENGLSWPSVVVRRIAIDCQASLQHVGYQTDADIAGYSSASSGRIAFP